MYFLPPSLFQPFLSLFFTVFLLTFFLDNNSFKIKGLSPIIHFYPEVFEVDIEGKKNDWEGVVKIPFIDEKE